MKPSCIFMEIGRYFIACYAHFELDKKEFEIKFPIFFQLVNLAVGWIPLLAVVSWYATYRWNGE